ncbi:C45 family autoproteolytic acyltransferase/hydolase [soil metagenome]
MRTLEMSGSPSSIGRRHGAALAEEIGRYLAERMRLTGDGSWTGRRTGREDILAVADSMIDAHARYAPHIHAEVEAMADAAGVSISELIILGGFTDVVDVMRAPVGEDDCTALLVPAHHANAGYLAQTWDMHDTAGQFVVLCQISPDHGPTALVFTTAGCVGQMGMNEAGICVGINNLTARRGQPGVTWPYVVRKVLSQTDIDLALKCVLEADLAGAHNYLLMGPDGVGYNVEAMPGKVAVDELESLPLVHTNHCLHASTRALEASRPGALTESSVTRHRRATELVASGGRDMESLWEILSDEGSICRRAQPPDNIESCGAVVMRPDTLEMWVADGVPADTPPVRFVL